MSATFVIQIKANTSGVQASTTRVERDLDKVKNKALEVNRAIRQIFGVFAIRELATGLYGLVDTYTSLRNKLNVVSKDQANLNGLMDATFAIAQKTRTSWDATGQMFSRMAMNSKQLGASQVELLSFTESLNKAIVIGGATATEASAGLLQLSQGMASGALKGDELRAVLEELPIVADVIANKLHVTRGQLRQMGTDGKITGKVILDAFKDARVELDEKFAKTVPTIAQSFDMIKNAAEKFFGEAGTGSGVLAGLAKALKFVSDHFDTIGKVILAVGQAFLGLYALKGIVSLFRSLYLVIAANPFTAFIVAVVTVIMLLRQFGDQIKLSSDGAATLGDLLRVIWYTLVEIGKAIYNFVEDSWTKLTTAFSEGLDGEGIEFSIKNVLIFIAAFVDAAIGLFRLLKNSIVTVFGGIPVLIGDVLIKIGQAIAKMFEYLINKIVDGFNGLKKYSGGIAGFVIPDVGHVDFSFSNPLNGAGGAMIDKFKQDWKDALGTHDAKDAISEIMDQAEHDAALRKATLDKKKILDKPTDPYQAAPGSNKKKRDEYAALLKQLESMLKKSNEVREAQLKLADTEKLLDGVFMGKGKHHGEAITDIITKEFGVTAATAISDMTEELYKAAHPHEVLIGKIVEETAAMEGNREQYELTKAVQEQVNSLNEKGAQLKDWEIKQLERVMKLQADRVRQHEIEMGILDRSMDKNREYIETLQAMYKLRAKGPANGGITNADFNREFLTNQDAFTGSHDADYERWRSKMDKIYPLMGGIRKGFDDIEKQMTGVVDATADVMMKAFGNIESFILKTVDTGKFAWNDLIDGMLQALDRLALKILEQWLLMKALGFSMGLPPISGNSTDLLNPNTPAFANGGSGVIGGSGGPDSKLFLARVTPGEHFEFTPPGRKGGGHTHGGSDSAAMGSMASKISESLNAMAAAIASQQSGPTVINNRLDPKALMPVFNTREGQQAVLNIISANSAAVKAMISKS
jgi:tape measure domain-containing protein